MSLNSTGADQTPTLSKPVRRLRVYRHKKYAFADVIRFIVLIIGATTMLVPLLWMITVALKSNNAVFQIPPQ